MLPLIQHHVCFQFLLDLFLQARIVLRDLIERFLKMRFRIRATLRVILDGLHELRKCLLFIVRSASRHGNDLAKVVMDARIVGAQFLGVFQIVAGHGEEIARRACSFGLGQYHVHHKIRIRQAASSNWA